MLKQQQILFYAIILFSFIFFFWFAFQDCAGLWSLITFHLHRQHMLSGRLLLLQLNSLERLVATPTRHAHNAEITNFTNQHLHIGKFRKRAKKTLWKTLLHRIWRFNIVYIYVCAFELHLILSGYRICQPAAPYQHDNLVINDCFDCSDSKPICPRVNVERLKPFCFVLFFTQANEINFTR